MQSMKELFPKNKRMQRNLMKIFFLGLLNNIYTTTFQNKLHVISH